VLLLPIEEAKLKISIVSVFYYIRTSSSAMDRNLLTISDLSAGNNLDEEFVTNDDDDG